MRISAHPDPLVELDRASRILAEGVIGTDVDGDHCGSHGAIIPGKALIEKTFPAGGLPSWTLTDHFSTSEREAAQWIFECTWRGQRGTFEGATISRHEDGLIKELREYETSAPLYDWDGTWH
ncbi:hypothetical protein GCM10009591_37790 [Brachybacterium tyrofermentans]